MNLSDRQKKIIEIVKEYQPVSGENISELLDVSRATLRSDLSFLTMAEILQANCYVLNKEFKTSYNKILVKAESVVKIMYLTEENTINNVEANIPVMGFIDIPNVSEDNMCNIQYNLKNHTYHNS